MLQTVPSAALVGLEVVRVRVEVSITRGTPLIQVVGLPESAVREGRERIRAAAAQLGLHVPGLRITVNLAPADVRKHGAAFDLPIILGILAASIPAGTSITIEYRGSNHANGSNPTAWSNSVDIADGRAFVQYRVKFVADPVSGAVPSVDTLAIPY